MHEEADGRAVLVKLEAGCEQSVSVAVDAVVGEAKFTVYSLHWCSAFSWLRRKIGAGGRQGKIDAPKWRDYFAAGRRIRIFAVSKDGVNRL